MSYKPLLAFLALATIMLTGCKEPAGLPNSKVHAALAGTYYCRLSDSTSEGWSGHVDLFSGRLVIDSFIDSFSPVIRRGYTSNQGRSYPRQIGFSVFSVPQFDGASGVVVCTLYYYQSAHSGTPSLSFRDIGITTAPASRHDLYWGAWDSNVEMATDSTRAQDGWCKVALTDCSPIITLGRYGGGSLYAGWVYDSTASGIYTEVSGATAYGYCPFIKVVVTN